MKIFYLVVNSNGLKNVLFNVIIFLLAILKSEIMAQNTPQVSSNREYNIQLKNNIFKPGHAIQILVYPDTTSFLHNTFPIDADGYVFLPIMGKVKVSDKSESEFTQYIKLNYSKYLRVPDVQIRILIRLSILGGFNRPGLYYIDDNATLWDLVKLANGTIEGKGLREMKWERDKSIVKSDLIPYFEASKSLKDIGVKSGDQFWTPSPNQPGFIDNLAKLIPFISVGIASYTLYLTYQIAFNR